MIVRADADIDYPDTDGEPIAESSTQFDAISALKWGLEELFANQPDVAIHGDLFWYATQGDATDRQAPDTMVVFGRPKQTRSSYLQWLEGGIAPQVVFEVLSPSNTHEEMVSRREWYDEHGVEEYYQIDPELRRAEGWLRDGGRLVALTPTAMSGWVSPRLGIRFEQRPGPLLLRRPDGEPLEPVLERFVRGRLAEHEARRQRDRADAATRERDDAVRERDDAFARMERLVARLRALGEDPDAPA